MPASLRRIVSTSSFTLTALLLAACGGKVVVDADNTGGASSTTGVATGAGGAIQTGPTTGGGGSASCDDLLGNLLSKLTLAQACDPTLNSEQCSGDFTVLDTCACVTVAGAGHPKDIVAAGNAFDQWKAAGCGPFLCDHCPPAPPSTWYCDGMSKKCMPTYEK